MSAIRTPLAKPVVGVTADRVTDDGVDYDRTRCRYLRAVRQVAGGVPVIIPNVIDCGGDAAAVLAALDGLLLTGSRSNVAASRYGAAQLASAACLDPDRDLTALSLIPLAVDMGIPLLAICRGLQEMNVAYGGSLHQDLASLAATVGHLEDETRPRDEQYLPQHEVAVSGTLLAGIVDSSIIKVNSLHNQGIAVLAPGLQIEGTAPDGLIEAASVSTASTFALGVQWHPEWHASTDQPSSAIFWAFGDACRKRALRRACNSKADRNTNHRK